MGSWYVYQYNPTVDVWRGWGQPGWGKAPKAAGAEVNVTASGVRIDVSMLLSRYMRAAFQRLRMEGSIR